MRKFLLLAILLCMSLPAAHHTTAQTQPATKAAQGKVVYICTGSRAECYHTGKNCRGLNACKGTIKAVSYESIKSSRRACKICCR